MGMNLPPDVEAKVLAAAGETLKPPRPRKYRNTPTAVDGIRFDSAREARRYATLRFRERLGLISDLELQPRYPLVVCGVKVGEYRADFRYRVPTGGVIVEDAKGVRTPAYRLKRKLMLACYGVRILEV